MMDKPVLSSPWFSDSLRKGPKRDRVMKELTRPLARFEVARAILVVGLRDLLSTEADSFLDRWAAATGIDVR
jgi:hypothetical protein